MRSQGQRRKDPRALPKSLSFRAQGIAGEHPAAVEPPARIRDREGAHAPAAAVPVDDQGPENAVGIQHIKDVSPAVGEQYT